MLGISTRGEGAHVICRCLSTSVLSGWRSIMEFFWGVWKLANARGRWGLPSLTPSTLTQSADQQVKATTQPNYSKGQSKGWNVNVLFLSATPFRGGAALLVTDAKQSAPKMLTVGANLLQMSYNLSQLSDKTRSRTRKNLQISCVKFPAFLRDQ